MAGPGPCRRVPSRVSGVSGGFGVSGGGGQNSRLRGGPRMVKPSGKLTYNVQPPSYKLVYKYHKPKLLEL